LASLAGHQGHYTVRIDPLASKELLHRHGFYYCDTLFEPFADRKRFTPTLHPAVTIAEHPRQEIILSMCHGAFRHGRFHRDHNLDPELADLRYDQWVVQLCDEGNVFALLWHGEPAAFFGFSNSKIVLHAVATPFQGKGLAKFLWSQACCELFDRGHSELCSSVSASNVAIVNLYASLGFRFRNPTDLYHRMIK
jgi:ribosomal protein S18 acetylase RimI-like enzyme